MTDLMTTPPTAQLTTLAEYKEALLRLEGEMKERMLEIGQLLAEVAALLRHNKQGGFEGWVENELGWTRQTAYNYLKVHKTFNQRLKTVKRVLQLAIPQTGWYELAADKTPEAARQEVLEKAEQGATLTVKEIRQVIKKHQPPVRTGITHGAVAAKFPQTFCLFCRAENIPIYPLGMTPQGICQACHAKATDHFMQLARLETRRAKTAKKEEKQ